MCKIEILEVSQEKYSIRQMIKIENGNFVNVKSSFADRLVSEVLQKGISEAVMQKPVDNSPKI